MTARQSILPVLVPIGNPHKVILSMLITYFDESGEHHKGGRLKVLTLAGCGMPSEDAIEFDTKWRAILDGAGIDHLHMSQLMSRKHGRNSPYHGWTPQKRKQFLGEFVKLMAESIRSYYGQKLPQEPTETAALHVYQVGVTASIVQAVMSARLYYEDDVSLVFASHPELLESQLTGYCDQVRLAMPSLKSVTVCQASACSGLQAADLFAYELNHCKDWYDFDNFGPTLRALRGSVASFFVNASFPALHDPRE